MAPRVWIDGHAGTTGLRIRQWLAERDDLDLVTLPDERRKDDSARREALAAADVAILCLPDEAAREVARWGSESGTRILDASTAHRVAEGWIYGLPELEPGQRAAIAGAARVSNPGCYPSAFVLLVRPLVDAGLLPADAPIAVHALSGYSGGGRELIERWEDPAGALGSLPYEAPYALDRVHKHAPELRRYALLARDPYFLPAVGAFHHGMRVQVPLPAAALARRADAKRIWESLHERYREEPFVRVEPLGQAAGPDELRFDPRRCNETNRIDLHVLPHPDGHVLLMALLDNLGKGASGVAIQNLNLMLGLPETRGLPV